MKIELRNLKVSKQLSEETTAFTATVYIDGEKAGTASNHGTGGCNNYHPHSLEARLNEYAKTLPPTKWGDMTMEMDADLLIGDLIEDYEVAALLRRDLKKKIVFIENEACYTTKLVVERREEHLAHFKRRHPDAPILNLLPEAEALKLYRQYAVRSA